MYFTEFTPLRNLKFLKQFLNLKTRSKNYTFNES